MTIFHSFWWLGSTPFCKYHTFCILVSTWILHISSIMNNAAVNIGMQTCLQNRDFLSYIYIYMLYSDFWVLWYLNFLFGKSVLISRCVIQFPFQWLCWRIMSCLLVFLWSLMHLFRVTETMFAPHLNGATAITSLIHSVKVRFSLFSKLCVYVLVSINQSVRLFNS